MVWRHVKQNRSDERLSRLWCPSPLKHHTTLIGSLGSLGNGIDMPLAGHVRGRHPKVLHAVLWY